MYTRSGPGQSDGGLFGFPPAITKLVLINAAAFLLQALTPYRYILPDGLALIPAQVMTQGMVWELVTYMFLHGDTWHLLFNMFYLVMFGSDLERYWGSRDFTKYYFVTGIGAGIIHIITSYIFGGANIPTIGASGAIFGVLLAYGMAFPHRKILLWFVIPVSARTLVIFAAAVELMLTIQYQGGDGVARFAHMGGMLVGYLYLKQETLLMKGQRALNRARQGAPRPQDPDDPDEERVRRERIDAILEKISREGTGAITPEERRLLEESARRARRRQNRD